MQKRRLSADFPDRLALRQQNLRLAQVIDDLFYRKPLPRHPFAPYGKDPAASIL